MTICTLIAVACGDKGKVPKEVIGKDKMKKILIDMNLADAFGRDITEYDSIPMTDSLRELRVKKYYSQVLALNKVSIKEFMDSYRWYEAHPDVYEEVLKNMLNDVTARKAHFDTLETRRQQHITDSMNKREQFLTDSIKKANPKDSADMHKIDSIKIRQRSIADSIRTRDQQRADSLLRVKARASMDSTAKVNKKRFQSDTVNLRKRQDSIRKILQQNKRVVL
ncbi:DUF4296 domain-containing protein [Chitinophaga sedimenti]|uniref:DUF4296 domain-containing protein n=1 Tax=Chitinophaga sedimenti TaxID=2033606 RepID=UPI00200527A4|nr:DUF4296 domain-containing protein [Chitinophaga sedimenti]MCK7559611.1 DUF4296 domain-containing protein [Chitinophaga sedimenti]